MQYTYFGERVHFYESNAILDSYLEGGSERWKGALGSGS